MGDVVAGPVNVDVDRLYGLCGRLQGGRAIKRELFERVVQQFATGARMTVVDVRNTTGVLINHVGAIVNRLMDAGYLRVWRGYGGKHSSRQAAFMLLAEPEFEPLYQPEDGPRPPTLSNTDVPRWGDDINPLINAFAGYTRRRPDNRRK